MVQRKLEELYYSIVNNKDMIKANMLYIFLCVFFLISCVDGNRHSYELKRKVVNKKTTVGSTYLISFMDGSDDHFSFGLYSLVESGDTMIFKNTRGITLNAWNSDFVTVNKKSLDN